MQGEAGAKLNTPVAQEMLETVHAISWDREGVGFLGNKPEGLLNVEASREIEFEVGAVKVQS